MILQPEIACSSYWFIDLKNEGAILQAIQIQAKAVLY
jgi:hypothetical protein